jgi:exosortase A-associated hydrolase 2
LPVRGDFIAGPSGALAVVSWRARREAAPTFVVLHLPAFADEMNKSRRMVARQACAIAEMGGAAFVLDPYGTGDSEGDFGDATWRGWQDDVQAAWLWVRAGIGEHVPALLWGSRLGALLAVEAVRTGTVAPSALLLWQPIAAGRRFIDGLLRIAELAGSTGAREGSARAALRDRLDGGQRIEVAGYSLSPDLVSGIDALELSTVPVLPCPVTWREIVAVGEPAVSPWATAVADRWLSAGGMVDLGAVSGPSFWASAEIEEAPALLSSTSEALRRSMVTRTRGA